MIRRYRCQRCGNISKSFWFWKLYRCKWITGISRDNHGQMAGYNFCYGAMVEEKQPMKYPLWTYLKYSIGLGLEVKIQLLTLAISVVVGLGCESFWTGLFFFSLFEAFALFGPLLIKDYREQARDQEDAKRQRIPTQVRVEEPELDPMADWDERFQQVLKGRSND